MLLKEIIIQKIKENGPVSFRDYMEMALYYPDLGYYTSAREKFGKEGDYYTSPVISSIYGQMIARQLEEMWHLMNKGPFTIVEYGAGAGTLASSILQTLKMNSELYDSLQYIIIEKSNSLREKQAQILNEKVSWIEDIATIKGFRGCVLTNEVLDNFAVHTVVMQEDLREVFVDYQEGFMEIKQPAKQALKDYLAIQNVKLIAGFRTEINLEANTWLEKIATNMHQGYIMTIDYGYTASEYYSEKRSLGTLACYYRHTVTEKYYENIGSQDITAHVNFTALKLYGEQYGLQFAGFCNQNYFLRSLGLANHLRTAEMAMTPDSFQEIHRLIMEMGNKFKVLIQKKNVEARFLTGMQFSARDIG